MCKKTKLLIEKTCYHCKNDNHLLYFRFIEHNIVYFFAKCTKCNYSFRQNCSIEKWKLYQEEDQFLQELTRHHRKPRSLNGSDDSSNISLVPKKKHVAYHVLFGTKTPKEIAECLTKIWIDPMYKLIAVKNS
jgi:hypothetical protein